MGASFTRVIASPPLDAPHSLRIHASLAAATVALVRVPADLVVAALRQVDRRRIEHDLVRESPYRVAARRKASQGVGTRRSRRDQLDPPQNRYQSLCGSGTSAR